MGQTRDQYDSCEYVTDFRVVSPPQPLRREGLNENEASGEKSWDVTNPAFN